MSERYFSCCFHLKFARGRVGFHRLALGPAKLLYRVSDFALSKESDAAAKRFMDEVREVIKEQDAKHP